MNQWNEIQSRYRLMNIWKLEVAHNSYLKGRSSNKWQQDNVNIVTTTDCTLKNG